MSLGATLPLDGTRELIRQSDLLVAAGTELSPVEQLYTGNDLSLPPTVVRIDIDPAQLAGSATTHPVFGDAAPALGALARQMTRSPAPDAASRVERARSAASQALEQEPFGRLLTLIARLLPAAAIVALDSTQAAYPATHLMTIGRGRSWLAPYTFGTLGCALPMALGAKAAQPDRPVVVLAGDGGLLFTMQEMATAVAERLPVVAIVWDNSAYGEIRSGMRAAKITPIGVEIAGTDLLQIAAGFDWRTVAVTHPEGAEAAIIDALAASHPALIRLDAKGTWT